MRYHNMCIGLPCQNALNFSKHHLLAQNIPVKIPMHSFALLSSFSFFLSFLAVFVEHLTACLMIHPTSASGSILCSQQTGNKTLVEQSKAKADTCGVFLTSRTYTCNITRIYSVIKYTSHDYVIYSLAIFIADMKSTGTENTIFLPAIFMT